MNFFKNWLKKQRQKDEIEAKNMAFFLALAVTSVIFLIWVFTVINTGFNNNLTENNQANSYETAKPIDSLISNFKSVVGY